MNNFTLPLAYCQKFKSLSRSKYFKIPKVFSILLLTIYFAVNSDFCFAQISRTQIINNASSYVTFSWTAKSCNLWNGTSCSGANIYHAPWVTSAGTYTSMPYCWGGWSSQSEYNTAMTNCKSAGQVCSSSGGGCTGLSSAPLSCAAGFDCSGLVTRAWALSSKYSTSTLPNISSEISLSSVQPGDILNDAGSHVRLVSTNNGSSYTVIESSGTDWKTAYHTYTPAQLTSYDPRCPNSNIVTGGCGSVSKPANDDCSGAITLTPNTTCSKTSGDIAGATQSYAASGCSSGLIQDVWYKFTATANGTYTIKLTPSSSMDGIVEVRQGSCTGTVLGCKDSGGGNGGIENLDVSVTNGTTYYLRVYEYNSAGNTTPPASTTFDICVTGASTSSCTYSLSKTSQSFSYSGGSGSFTINATANSGCKWDVSISPTSDYDIADFSTITNGTGPYTVKYDVEPNPTNKVLTCIYTVTGNNGYSQDYIVTQDANTSCDASFSSSSANFTPSGGNGTFNIVVGADCFWNITNNCSSMITNLNPTDGYGPTTVTYKVLSYSESTTRSCKIRIQQNNAAYTITQQGIADYTIATSSNPSAGGTTSGSGTYQSGQSCTVTATPNSGYTFTNWTENGTQVSANSSYTFTLSGNRTLVANFTQNPVNYIIYTSSSPTAGGTTSGGGTYQSGQSRTVTATANNGYTFSNWTENGTQVSTNASYTFTLSGDRTLVANFTQNPVNYPIYTSSSPTAGGTTSGSGTYQSGQSCTVTATPNSGYTFTNWTENGTQVSANSSYTFTLSGNRNLVANFITSSSCTAPSAPSTCSASIGDPANGLVHTLNLSCDIVPDAEGYFFEYSVDGITWNTSWGSVSSNEITIDLQDRPNVPRYYRVRAFKCNPVMYSNYTYASPQPIYTACDDPAVSTINGATSNSLNITFNAETPVENPSYTTYSVYCTTTSQYVQTNGSLGSNEVFQTKNEWGTKSVTGLINSKEYCFYAKARNNNGDIRFNASNFTCGTTASASCTAPIVGAILQPTCTLATGSVTLSGLPNVGTWTLTITPRGTTITGTGTSTTITGLAAGTYNFTVTNSAGCISTSTTNVVLNSQPTAPETPIVGTITQPTCSVATGSVVLSGLPTGNWTINPGTMTGSTASTTITGLTAGTYNFSVTNSVGCTSATSANVVINSQPTAPETPSVGTITQPTCSVATGSVVLSSLPTGNWTINPGEITGSTSSKTISNLAPGTYNFTVTNSAGCISAATANVVINSQPTAPATPTVGTITQPTCSVATGSVVLSGLPAGSWTINPGAITGSTASKTISNLAAGTYNFTVTNSAGCISAATGNVVINPKSTPVTPTISLNGNILHSNAASGNQWYNQNGLVNSATTQDYTPLSSGDYYVVVSINGCSSIPSNSIHYIPPTGIDPTEFTKSMKVYPNPITNELTIELEGNTTKTNFEILNSLGQVVFNGSLIEKTIVQTVSFASGVYMIKLKSGKSFEFKKIIKN